MSNILGARLTVRGIGHETKNRTATTDVNSKYQSGDNNSVYTARFPKSLKTMWDKEASKLRTEFNRRSVGNPNNQGFRCFTGDGFEKYREVHNRTVDYMHGELRKEMRDTYERHYKEHLRSLGDTPGLGDNVMSPDVFMSKFAVNMRVEVMQRPELFNDIIAVDKADIEQQFKDDMQEFNTHMYQEMKELLGKVITSYNGKKIKDAKSAAINNLHEYIKIAKLKNVVNDPQFNKFVDDINNIVKGVSIDDIKEYDTVRESLRNSASDLITSINTHKSKGETEPVDDDELFSMFG